MAQRRGSETGGAVPREVLGRVVLVTGPEEFLAERAVQQVRELVRGTDAEAEVSETVASDLSMASLGDLAAPSLFSTTRCVTVRRLEDLPDDAGPGLLDYAAQPADDVALVLVHGGGQKGSGLLTKLRKADAVVEVKTAAPTPRELPGFVTAELRGHGSRIEPEAADFLVLAVGHDLRSLSAAAHQLASDFEGRPVTTEMVKQYFGGRAEAKSFVVADHALFGRTTPALEELRWALDGGTAPVLVSSALAAGLRGLARLMSAPRGQSEGDLARAVGVPPWKIKTLRSQARGWEPASVGHAIRVVARADADIKGQASDPAYALERAVITVSTARQSS